MTKVDFPVTVVICTYGRAEQVKVSLSKLAEKLSVEGLGLPVLVIDNNSGDGTKAVIDSILSENQNFRYVKEKAVGLSHARNRAVEECQTEYIAFLDDDAYPADEYFYQLLEMCRIGFDVAGGSQIPFSDFEIPEWYRLEQEWGERDLAAGFNMIYRKAMIQQVGLFDTTLGMRGKKIAYGEDIQPQIRIKKLGGKFIYNRKLKVHHYIQPYKTTKRWQLMSSYAHGRDSWKLFDRERLSKFDVLYLFREFMTKHFSFSTAFSKQKSMAFELGRLIGAFFYRR